MPNALASFTVTRSNNNSINKLKWFSSLFHHLSHFFVLYRLWYKQLLDNTCQPYKICYRTACIAAADFKSLIKNSNKIHLLKRIFLHREKDQTKHFSPYRCKRRFDKQPILLQRVPFKIHFKWLFRQGIVEIRGSHWNKKSFIGAFRFCQRSMMEPFRVNS